MMTFLIVLFTIVLVLNCLILGLLILIQLPKKEAGVGVAFGGGTTDALFGAGSGNALTKLTKYSAISFFCVVIFLSILNSHAKNSAGQKLREQLGQNPPATPEAVSPAAPTTPSNAVAKPGTNSIMIVPPTAATSNVTTNAAPTSSAVTNVPPVK
ncbi:MAG: preprotein translocase subunit SecG [Pedosphaera sp.]|nr:preprotein translocase subunit SecG [Pedosphaera sp.]